MERDYAGKFATAFSFAGANLQRKYGDDWKQTVPVIVQSRLRSWGINTIGDWSDETLRLLRRTPYTDTVSSHGAPNIDLVAFQTKAAEHYFRTVRDSIKSVAPKQLYLGCRFATVNDLAAIAAGKYCDVVSYNRYEHSIAKFNYPGTDKPLIIGEFHFGALDRGLFHTGLVPVWDQLECARQLS